MQAIPELVRAVLNNWILVSDGMCIGLDEASLTEIRRLMERHAIGFDEARHVRHVEILKKNGIDQFGFPMDPKAITSLS